MSLDSHSETETSEAVAIQDEPLREKPRVQKADSTNTRVGDTLLYQVQGTVTSIDGTKIVVKNKLNGAICSS